MSIAELVPPQGEWEDRAWFPPGPKLAICLSDDRLSALSGTELVEMAAAARRQTSWSQARELAAIAELTRRRTQDEDDGDLDYRVLSAHESVVEEVATALSVTGNAAATLVHLAERLGSDLPATREALEAGRIDLPRARVICDLSDGLPDGVASQVEAAVIEHAPHQTTGQLRRRIQRVVRRLAPDRLEDRKQEAITGRRLEVWETPDGTADLSLRDIAPEDAAAIHNKISAVARSLRLDGDPRSLDQIRVDLAKELLRGADLPEAVRGLLAQSEPDAQTGDSHHDPVGRVLVVEGGVGAGDLTGAVLGEERQSDSIGPEERALIRGLAADVDERLAAVAAGARFHGRLDSLAILMERAVRDMCAQVAQQRDSWCQSEETQTHGHPGYRPPAAMRQLVEERHTTCIFPTCNHLSERCDLDHTIPFGTGITCKCNLAPLCRRHHRTKQTRDWHLFQIWPGVLIWLTPTGKWHIVLPDRQ